MTAHSITEADSGPLSPPPHPCSLSNFPSLRRARSVLVQQEPVPLVSLGRAVAAVWRLANLESSITRVDGGGF